MPRSLQGLQPSAPRPRKKRPPVKARGRARYAEWQELREQVYARAQGRCERCGRDLEDTGLECHHRRLRSQGGRDEVENLAALCPACHHQGVHAHPERARAEGWIVRERSHPERVAVILWDGRVVRLDPDGTYDVCLNADGTPA